MRIRDSQLNSHPLTFVWFTSSCGGSGDANVRATFSAFDADGDGFLSLEEMTLYIASIFRVRYETHGAGGIDATPDELAAATAAECFADAGLADGDELSFEAFYEWYAAGTAPSAAPAMALGIVEGADAPPAAVVSGLRAMRDGLGLVGRDVDSIFELFAQVRLGGGRFFVVVPSPPMWLVRRHACIACSPRLASLARLTPESSPSLSLTHTFTQFTDDDGTIARDSFQMCFGQLVKVCFYLPLHFKRILLTILTCPLIY